MGSILTIENQKIDYLLPQSLYESRVLYKPFNNPHNAVVFKNCTISNFHVFLGRGDDKFTFENCTFLNSEFDLGLYDNHLKFDHCKFVSLSGISGKVDYRGKVRFIKCEGLVINDFYNPYQTLTEMGLYQTFKDCVLSAHKEEVVYKKVGIYCSKMPHGPIGTAVVTLVIPKGVVRYGTKTGKCRCEKAIVKNIEAMFPFSDIVVQLEGTAKCWYGSKFDCGLTVYEVGKEVKSDLFDYIPNKCSYGIHYFYDRKLAEEYDFS